MVSGLPNPRFGGQALKSAHQQRVEEFHTLGGHETPVVPTTPDDALRYRRAKLILEETLEVLEALGFSMIVANQLSPISDYQFDMAHTIKELSDLSVVTTGTFSSLGISDERFLAIVDESNTAKVRGGVKYNEYGKILKPEGWVNPESTIRKELEQCC